MAKVIPKGAREEQTPIITEPQDEPVNDIKTKMENKQVFSIPALREYTYKLFGVSPSTYDGATYNMTGEYTVEQMQAHIAAWLKKEVV